MGLQGNERPLKKNHFVPIPSLTLISSVNISNKLLNASKDGEITISLDLLDIHFFFQIKSEKTYLLIISIYYY